MPIRPAKTPAMFTLPQPTNRAASKEEERVCLTLRLQTITPIYGGSTKPRHVEKHDPIRGSSIRGSLLFWWRALQGHTCDDSRDLYKKQNALWGGVFGEDVTRSKVEITVKVTRSTEIEKSDINLRDPDAYALFPARGVPRDGIPAAERWKKGVEFELKLWVPKSKEEEVKRSVRAWLMFGGYGGRTRRGLGSLTVRENAEEWLPKAATLAEFRRLLGDDVFQEVPEKKPSQTPSLLGAQVCKGKTPSSDSERAWHAAIGWLKNFRQEQGAANTKAREPGTGRPGRSRWPEADKVRQVSGRGPWAHPPRHNRTPVWPRASFGLPIIGQFQRKDANGQPYPQPEPRDFEITWYQGETKRNRLASALIVKAMALAGGQFVAVALWMYRAFPEGKVGLADPQRAAGSKADFDVLVAQGDTALCAPLRVTNAPRAFAMREAFFGWLGLYGNGEKVA